MIKCRFSFGDWVRPSKLAVEYGALKGHETGIVVFQSQLEPHELLSVRVHIRGRKTSSGYASAFWEKAKSDDGREG